MSACQDAKLRSIYDNAALVLTDGMPLVWAARQRGQRNARRVAGPDLVAKICEASVPHGHRHYFLGGAPGVAEAMATALQGSYPGLQIAGWHAPAFGPPDATEHATLIDKLNTSQIDILWVGLGAPKQEKWISQHLAQLNIPLQIGVGAAFDFHAGSKTRAPTWMQSAGLEWLHRLGSEPARLWRRYLLTNLHFAWRYAGLLRKR